MKSNKRKAAAAFTLVELLAVVIIIIMLFGMVVGGLKYAQDKQANEKTRVQLARIGNAIENYKLDKGLYPVTTDGDGSGNSNELFKSLYWDSDDDGVGADTDDDQKVYMSELDPKNKKLGWLDGTSASDYKIIDAWSNEIHYRSGKDSNGDNNTSAINPDFDLWSPGKDGSTKDDPKSPANRDDLKNH